MIKAAKRPLPAKVHTALADEYRMPIYPVSKAKGEVLETKFGTVRFVRGGLTAHHRDVMDVVTAFADKIDFAESGEVDIYFDPAKIAKVLGINAEWRFQRELLRDLVGTVIEVKRAGVEKWEGAFSVLTFVGDTDEPAERARWEFKTNLKKISLSKHYAALMQTDVALQLGQEVVRHVVGLRHQVSRSSAKWLLSHTGEQHHKINDLLSYVGCKGNRAMMSKYKKQLTEDSVGLDLIGITVDNRVVHYARNKAVFITVGRNVHQNSVYPDAGDTDVHQNSACNTGGDADVHQNSTSRGDKEGESGGDSTCAEGISGCGEGGRVDVHQNSVSPGGNNADVHQSSASVHQNSACVYRNSASVHHNSTSSKGICLKEDLKDCSSGSCGGTDALQKGTEGVDDRVRWTFIEFRKRYEEFFGLRLHGGLSNRVSNLCLNHTVGAIEYAFEEAALSGVVNLRYIEAVLENKANGGRASAPKGKTSKSKSDGSSLQGGLEGYWQ